MIRLYTCSGFYCLFGGFHHIYSAQLFPPPVAHSDTRCQWFPIRCPLSQPMYITVQWVNRAIIQQGGESVKEKTMAVPNSLPELDLCNLTFAIRLWSCDFTHICVLSHVFRVAPIFSPFSLSLSAFFSIVFLSPPVLCLELPYNITRRRRYTEPSISTADRTSVSV